jgi:polysaccharide export outer membrane protein
LSTPPRNRRHRALPAAWFLLAVLFGTCTVNAQTAPPLPAASVAEQVLYAGDEVNLEVYGQPDMSSPKSFVQPDGKLPVKLISPVPVAGLSPADAAVRVEEALRSKNILVHPSVTITLLQTRNRQVSVIGEVHNPGRFPIESSMTILDLLAVAGGMTADASDTVLVLRPDGNGSVTRLPVDLKGFADPSQPLPVLTLRGGDSVFVPRAPDFYIYGEVHSPNKYRLEPGMRVVQAIAKGGGPTDKASTRRVEIKRKGPDGEHYITIEASPTDLVQAGDMIRVKESIF